MSTATAQKKTNKAPKKASVTFQELEAGFKDQVLPVKIGDFVIGYAEVREFAKKSYGMGLYGKADLVCPNNGKIAKMQVSCTLTVIGSKPE